MDYISYMQVAHAYEPHDPTELALEPSEIIGVLEVRANRPRSRPFP